MVKTASRREKIQPRLRDTRMGVLGMVWFGLLTLAWLSGAEWRVAADASAMLFAAGVLAALAGSVLRVQLGRRPSLRQSRAELVALVVCGAGAYLLADHTLAQAQAIAAAQPELLAALLVQVVAAGSALLVAAMGWAGYLDGDDETWRQQHGL